MPNKTSGSNLLDSQIVFLKDFFDSVDFDKNQQHEKFSGGKELILFCSIFSSKTKESNLRNYTGGAELYIIHVCTPLTSFVYIFFYLCLSLTYCLVCVLQPCGYLLGNA